MNFILFKTFDGIGFYNDTIPQVLDHRTDPRVEAYTFHVTRDHWDEFEEDFVFPVDHYCDALLDIGDWDYFDAQKCVKLKEWLELRLAKEVPPLFDPIYRKLLEFSTRAIDYNTGVKIEIEW